MKAADRLKLVPEAGADHATLAFAAIEIALPGLPDADHRQLKDALAAAAIPHWYDAHVLKALLNTSTERARDFVNQIRQIGVAEDFPARGNDVCNLNEGTRRAIRAALRKDQPELFTRLSRLAQIHFGALTGDAAWVETLYHEFHAAPATAADRCFDTVALWQRGGEHDDTLHGIAVMLDELIREGLADHGARGVASFCLARIRYHHQPLSATRRLADASIADFEAIGDTRRAATARHIVARVLFDQRDYDEALHVYEEALAERKRLAEAAPNDPELRRDLSVTYERVGSALKSLGRIPEALAAFEADLAITRALKDEEPDSPILLRDLSISCNKVGNVQLERDPAAALRSYGESLEIRKKLVADHPDNRSFQRDLSVAHENVGEALRAARNLRGAAEHYRASLALATPLAMADAANSEWQRDVALVRLTLASVHQDAGELDAATRECQAAIAVLEPLVQRDEMQIAWLDDLRIAYQRLGDLFLSRGQPEHAVVELRAALTAAYRIKGDAPDQASETAGLWRLHRRAVDAMGEPDSEIVRAERSLSRAAAEHFAAEWPEDAVWRQIVDEVRGESTASVAQG